MPRGAAFTSPRQARGSSLLNSKMWGLTYSGLKRVPGGNNGTVDSACKTQRRTEMREFIKEIHLEGKGFSARTEGRPSP